MTLTDREARYMVIELLKAETDRDRQRTIGASNLANGCQFCLASNLTGDSRETPVTDRAWGGRVIGTAIHSILEERAKDPWFKERHPGALLEYRMSLGILGSYGPVGSTADLVLPSEQHAFDYKGTTNAKMALMIDYLATQRGEVAPYGRKHKVHKLKTLSEGDYAHEMRKVEYKIAGYYKQLQQYGLGLNREGIRITALTLLFVSRDDTMWFDNPSAEDYEHPARVHGTYALTFQYDEAFALSVWNRGLEIWEKLEAGATIADFPRHALCFPCSLDQRAAPAAAVEREYPSLPDDQIVRGKKPLTETEVTS